MTSNDESEGGLSQQERDKLTAMEMEIKELKEEIERLKNVCEEKVQRESKLAEELHRLANELKESKEKYLFCKIADKPKLVSHFTGLPDKESFNALSKLFDKIDIEYFKGWKSKKLDKENQLFLTLMKLRRNLTNLDLGTRFGIDETTVSNIFVSWIFALHHVLVKNLMATIPPREKNQVHLPESFKPYPSTRIIIDATEVTTANPKLLSAQCRMYSIYKHKITSKGLVGCSPKGDVTFVSQLYAGSTSDKKLTQECGLLNQLVPGDSIMADKGFTISDLLPDGVSLNIPPFRDDPQFTIEQVGKTRMIAAARIIIERVICRIKRFTILNYVPQWVAPYASEVFQVCAALVNFQNTLMKECEADSDLEE